MIEFITQITIGLLLIIIGIYNTKGNIFLLHSYHKKCVKKEDEHTFGKVIGIGTIIIGFTIIIANIIELVLNKNYSNITNIILIIGFTPGITIIFYALFKYNKGIF